jgi:hypothetical protein
MRYLTREQIDTLRKAAAALVEECTEPCWGLAQGLSELAEQLVLSTEEAPDLFADRIGEASCCPACGEYWGKHEAWCIHAHEQIVAEPQGEQIVVGKIYYETPESFCSYPGPRQCSNCERAGSNCGRLMADNPFCEPASEDSDQSFSDIMGTMGW